MKKFLALVSLLLYPAFAFACMPPINAPGATSDPKVTIVHYAKILQHNYLLIILIGIALGFFAFRYTKLFSNIPRSQLRFALLGIIFSMLLGGLSSIVILFWGGHCGQ